MRIQWKAGVLGCALGLLAAATTAIAEPPGGATAASESCCQSCDQSYNTCQTSCATSPNPMCEFNCGKGRTYCRSGCGGCQ